MENPETNIYLLYDQGEVVKVGISSVPHQAIKKHKTAGKIFDDWDVIPCKNKNAQDLKINFLFLHHPKYNKTIQCSKTNLSFIGYITPIPNKQISIPGIILNNKLYADLSEIGCAITSQDTWAHT